MNKKTTGIIALIIIVIAGIYYFANKKEAIAPVVVAPIAEQKELCYFRETVGAESTDDAFISINYGAGGKAYGIINTIPSEKDSLVGAYTGTVEKGEIPGYPTSLNIIYAANGEGIVSNEQEIILVGTSDIKVGTGEMEKGSDGIWKIKDMTKLTYDAPMPKVDCASVPDRIKADYSKTQ